MNYTVYIPDEIISPTLQNVRAHSTPFELINEDFQIVNSASAAEIIPVLSLAEEEINTMISYLKTDLKDKIILIMMHTHINDDDNLESSIQPLIDKWLKHSDKVAVVSLNYKTERDIFYDFCWNRQKSYFVDYDKHDLTNRLWTGNASEKMFTLGDIIKRGPYKKFMVPNRVHSTREDQQRNVLRQKLHDFVPDRYCHRGNPELGYVLYPQEMTTEMYNNVKNTFGGWSPISDDYYQTSFVSLYVETLTSVTTTGCITEKTFDPLIKGHFILPFGYKGIVADIKELGFILPKWIDYSYDTIDNTDERFKAYLSSITKLNQLTEFDMLDLFEQDKWILIANRNVFFIKPYDSLSKKIAKRFPKGTAK